MGGGTSDESKTPPPRPSRPAPRSNKAIARPNWWEEFWSEQNKITRNKWLSGAAYTLAALVLILIFIMLYRGWRPFGDDEQAVPTIDADTISFAPILGSNTKVEPVCRPEGNSRLCFPDTSRNIWMSRGTIAVDTTALPVKSTLCERDDTLPSSKIICRQFEVHR